MRRLMIVLMMVGGLFAAAPTAVAISPNTDTWVVCPATVELDVTVTCTAQVEVNLNGYPRPTGTVNLSSSGPGVLGSGGSCTLAPIAEPENSACTITYTPTAIGANPVHTLTGTYVPNGGHIPSDGATTIMVVKHPQPITLGTVFATPGQTRPFGAWGGGASGNPIRYAVDPATTNQACRIELPKGFVVGDPVDVAFLRVGDCVIRATQAGNAQYLPGVATQTIRVKYIQTLRWLYPKVPQGSVGGTSPILATTDPGLPVTYSIYPGTTNGSCTVTQTTVTYLAPGTCVIAANQVGNNNYHPTTVTTTVNVR